MPWMLGPCPPGSEPAPTSVELTKSPVTQLPDAEDVLFSEFPKGAIAEQLIGPMAAEEDPLPPALVEDVEHAAPVGPAYAAAETLAARARGAFNTTRIMLSAKRKVKAFRATLVTPPRTRGTLIPEKLLFRVFISRLLSV